MYMCAAFSLFAICVVDVDMEGGGGNEGQGEGEALSDLTRMNDQLNGAIDLKFYRTLWSLQQYFTTPLSLLPDHKESESAWVDFCTNMDVVLKAFEANQLSDLDGGGGSTQHFPKYLSNPRLLNLQLKDPSFRRYFALQGLITTHFLSSACTLPKRLPLPAKSVPKVEELNEKLLKLAEMTVPKGQSFAEKLPNLFLEESHWYKWKDMKCPSLAHPPAELIPGSLKLPTPKQTPRSKFLRQELQMLGITLITLITLIALITLITLIALITLIILMLGVKDRGLKSKYDLGDPLLEYLWKLNSGDAIANALTDSTSIRNDPNNPLITLS